MYSDNVIYITYRLDSTHSRIGKISYTGAILHMGFIRYPCGQDLYFSEIWFARMTGNIWHLGLEVLLGTFH